VLDWKVVANQVQNFIATGHEKKRCSMVSYLLLQRLHLKQRLIPYCCNLDSTGNLFCRYFQTTKLLVGGMNLAQIMLAQGGETMGHLA